MGAYIRTLYHIDQRQQLYNISFLCSYFIHNHIRVHTYVRQTQMVSIISFLHTVGDLFLLS